jgi:protoheme IX farnesyltransferase
MTSERAIAVIPTPNVALADYWALTKPDINFLIAITTFAGFYLGYPGRWDVATSLLLIHTLLGTVLVAAGTGTLNQYLEWQFDSQMRRTARRPVASGRIKPAAALWFGIGLSVAGGIYLAVAANLLASGLAIFTLLSYLFVYTPLKRKTPLCTLVGAIPGAMPPLIGWAAAHESLSPGAWVLYLILFLWQFPHFMAIAWMYREDYARAGYQVLPRGQARILFVVLQTVLPLLALVLVSQVARPMGQLGFLYSIVTSLLGAGFFYYGAKFALRRANTDARKLLFASIVYLPLLFVLMTILRA